MVNISRESVTIALLNEIEPLTEEYWAEVGTEGYDPKPDKSLYLRSSSSGSYAAYTLRSNGKLNGYLSYWVITHPHYLMNVAQMDLFFVQGQSRGFNALKMIKFSEKDLKESFAIDTIFLSTSIKKDISPLFKRLKYEDSDKMYMKRL